MNIVDIFQGHQGQITCLKGLRWLAFTLTTQRILWETLYEPKERLLRLSLCFPVADQGPGEEDRRPSGLTP